MNVLGIGPLELIIIMVVALVIFGPQRLPEIGAQIGKAIRDFRQMTNDVTGEFQRTMSLDDPPPPAALSPDPALARETIDTPGTPHANGVNGAGSGALVPQTIAADLPGSAVAAEEPWTPPADPPAAAPPVATKADPLAGASLLDLTPATRGANGAGHGAGEVPPDTTVTYTPAPISAAVPASFPSSPPSIAAATVGATDGVAYSSSDAWDAVVNTDATLPRPVEPAEVAATAVVATAGTGEPAPYVYTPEPVEPDAEPTIREKIEAQVAAEAFRERRRIASYNRPRKKD